MSTLTVDGMSRDYTAIPLSEVGDLVPGQKTSLSRQSIVKTLLLSGAAALVTFVLGVLIGRNLPPHSSELRVEHYADGHMLPQSFLPNIPAKSVAFEFPTKYEDKGPDGDELWKNLAPVGAGFVRVPYPRIYNMLVSEPIPDDSEEAEIYSLSITHQLHCLAVLRDVIIKYEKRDMSRFAGGGHEYHCLDYIRQAILCAGDTTLEYADDQTIGQDGRVTRYGFTGANSTHQCRDWDAIKAFAEQHRSSDRTGILV